MQDPANPLEAVIHRDPYPWYALLATDPALKMDNALGMRVAASRAAVDATLSSPLVGVRPATEPVPAGLVGNTAGAVFRELVRMNDGPGHAARKPAVTAALNRLTTGQLEDIARHQAATMAPDIQSFMFAYPVRVLGAWLGLDGPVLDSLPDVVRDFARGIGPGASREQMDAAGSAAADLVELFGATQAITGVDQDTAIANTLGFLFQAYDATAGLIGNTLLALGGVGPAAGSATSLPDLVRQVALLDPPIQNTRRLVIADGEIAGVPVRTGEAILVVLAAANHDPANQDHLESRSFGFGPHACPGERIACTIAISGVEGLLKSGVDPELLVQDYDYPPSANARIPLFRVREQQS